MKVKGQILQYEMRKRKIGMRIYPVIRFDTKSLLHPRCSSTQSRVSLPGNQVSSVNTITVTLIPFSTKELAHAGWGLHVPRTMSLTPLHTKLEGRPRAGKPPMLQGAGTPRYTCWFTLEPCTRQQYLPLSLT